MGSHSLHQQPCPGSRAFKSSPERITRLSARRGAGAAEGMIRRDAGEGLGGAGTAPDPPAGLSVPSSSLE